MRTTMDLIAKADALEAPLRQTSLAMGLHHNTLARAKAEGRLSPGLAATLARHLGEDPAKWALIAASESERSAPLKQHLRSLVRTLST